LVQASSQTAFKEWAVVVDALGCGEQTLILRKGGLHESRGQFQLEHREFWLFPTLYHEAERSIIPSKRPTLRDIAAATPKDAVDIQFYAVVETALAFQDAEHLRRLQGRHIWTEATLQQRFAFGRAHGLSALVLRVHKLSEPQRFVLRESYAGCKSWVELERPISTAGLVPVLDDARFAQQRDEIIELFSDHALAHP
jgi:hypothetical protein